MMSATNKVAIVIPFYRNSISEFENIALQQCKKVLANYPVIAIKPQSLVLPEKAQVLNLKNVISFDDEYFKGKKGYNSLMLSDTFYKAFLNYEYILVYQLDAFVFKDELSYWCSLIYDYIGAPWLRRKGYTNPVKDKAYAFKYYLHTIFNIKKQNIPTIEQFHNKVGNGGFSLRRVKKFYDLSVKLRSRAQAYLSQDDDRYNEDAFWSIEVNRHYKRLRIPPYKIGVKFSVEFEPRRALALNNGELPFGCHGWDLHLDFWPPVFKQYGYEI
jgi:hypothetical protein